MDNIADNTDVDVARAKAAMNREAGRGRFKRGCESTDASRDII